MRKRYLEEKKLSKKDRKSILIITDGNIDHASSRTRAIQYIPILIQNNWNVNWIPRVGKQDNNKLAFWLIKRFLKIKLLVVLAIGKYDCIFIQRFFLSSINRWILKKKKVVVVYDFDDGIHLKKNSKEFNKDFEAMIELSSKVIVSTHELYELVNDLGKSVTTINTPVDVSDIAKKNYKKLSKQDEIKIVWVGSPWTSHYLESLKTIFVQVSKKYKIKLVLIGANPSFQIKEVEIIHVKWEVDIENKILGRCDIGIMPLKYSSWEKFKGGYKLYLYMAACLPTIASPVGINKRIIENGVNGYLVKNTEQWIDKLELLCSNKDLRRELGENGYKLAVEKFDRKKTQIKLLKILEGV